MPDRVSIVGTLCSLLNWCASVVPEARRITLTPAHFTDVLLDPANGVQLKIWECYDGLPQQQWKITEDRIELIGYSESGGNGV